AVIDFLLLAQGHSCEEFEGMRCMNLPDHLTSIHKSIKDLQKGISKLEVDNGADWLNNL
ncbi:hypothetical protein N321_05856, partial [Antrostomus carolinensis]